MPAYYDESTKTWFCKFYYTDYTGTKKQKKKRGFKLQREAKEWERTFLERLQGTPNMTFQSLYDLYIEDMSHRLRQNSIDGKKNVFKNRILPYFKDKPVNAITPTDIRAWQNEQIDMGYSDAYLDRIQNIMTTILNYAVTYYNLPSNPCTRAGHMGKRTRSMSFWTIEQYNSFIPYISDLSAHTALQLLFYSGMRFGELLALTLANLDFKENTIHISFFCSTLHIAPDKTLCECEYSVRRLYAIYLMGIVCQFLHNCFWHGNSADAVIGFRRCHNIATCLVL